MYCDASCIIWYDGIVVSCLLLWMELIVIVHLKQIFVVNVYLIIAYCLFLMSLWMLLDCAQAKICTTMNMLP